MLTQLCKHGFVKQYTKLTILVYMCNNPREMSREREKISWISTYLYLAPRLEEIKHNKWIIHSWSSRWCSNQQKTRLTNTGWSNCPSCRPLCSSKKQFFLSLILFFKVSNYIKHCYTSDVLIFDFKKTFTYIYLLFFAIITLTFFLYVFISLSFPNFN